jgi:hypothetical protein
MPIRTIGSLLGATDELKALSARARRLRELQTLYVESAPGELAGSSRVKNFRAGTLFISADNAAVAAKLRHLTPTLLTSLRKIEAEITGIRIEVQVSGALHQRVHKSKKTALSADAVHKFEELAGRLRDGELKAAVTKLARRHGRGKSR